MGIANIVREGQGPGSLPFVYAHEILHGCVRCEVDRDGWSRPWRMTAEQVRALGSAGAWHPGLFRQMARSTAGICLEFETDACEVALEIKPDKEPAGTAAQLRLIDGEDPEARRPHDGLSVDVDGRHLDVRVPKDGVVDFLLEAPGELPEEGLMVLPGLGRHRRVRMWLPVLRGCQVRSLVHDGTYLRPVAKRRELLVLGDSIAQGFVADDPGLTWPALLAGRLGLDLLNQGIGGQVMQPGSLFGLPARVDPALIVVEFGANYRFEACSTRLVAADVRRYLDEVSRLWPEVPTLVVTPLWHDEDAWPTHSMSCFESVASLIAAQVGRHGQMTLVDGMGLMDHDSAVLADGFDHPNARGNGQIAERLLINMEAAGIAIAGVDLARIDPASADGPSYAPITTDTEARALLALETLDDFGLRATPATEAISRGLCEVRYAGDGVVLLDLGGLQMVVAQSPDVATDVVHALGIPSAPALVFCEGLEAEVRDALGLATVSPRSLCVFGSKRVEGPVPTVDIQPLDSSFAGVVQRRAPHPPLVGEDELASMLDEGLFLGAFEGEKIVGFVGEDRFGAIDMLFVLPGHRRRGIGTALELAKIREQLAAGRTPWCHVPVSDKAALALQERLGLTVIPATEQCLVF